MHRFGRPREVEVERGCRCGKDQVRREAKGEWKVGEELVGDCVPVERLSVRKRANLSKREPIKHILR